MAEITKADMQEAFERALKSRGVGGGGGGFQSGASSSAPSGSGDTSKAASNLESGIKTAASAVKSFAESANDNLGVWRGLSKGGASFSNDIIGMSVAAAQSRMSLADFAEVVSNNGKFLTGLGGSVTRGTEAFAKLSKGFFDNNFDSELRSMGYTTKEMNELLAHQVGIQGSNFKNDEESRKKVNESTANMAREMDLIAKLTGKSRSEQMEAMTRAKADGQVEAKMRLMSAGKSEKEIADLKLEYQAGLLEAQKNGTEQAYKEFFATGTYLSEQAATQAALYGKQMRHQEAEIKAMQSGDMNAALEERGKSAAAALKNASDPTILTVATFGSAAGQVGDVAKGFVETTNTLHHSVQAIAKENGILLGSQQSYSEALKKAREEITKAQVGADTKGVKKSGATQALLDIERSGQELSSGIAGAAEATTAEGKSVANALRDSGKTISDQIHALSGPLGRLSVMIETAAAAGQQPKTVNLPAGAGELERKKAEQEASGGAIGTATNLASKAANFAADTLKVAGNVIINGTLDVPGKSTGSLGTTGKLIEDFGAGTLTMLHGKEGVVTEDQMISLASGLKEQGVASAINSLKASIPSPTISNDQSSGLNMSKISDYIKTSISSVSPLGMEDNDNNAPVKDQLQPSLAESAISDSMSKTSDSIGTSIPKLLAGDELGMMTSLAESTGPISSPITPPAPKIDLNMAAKMFDQKLPEKKPATAAAAAATPAPAPQPATAQSTRPQVKPKESSLDDVVNSLNRLNTQMGQLINQQSELLKKQIKATQGNSSNIYAQN